MSETIASELDGIDLGDERLNKRSRRLIESLEADCQASINAAAGPWADTMAAYRFLDNPRIKPDPILKPHLEATAARIRECPVVVIAQDTTELDYTPHPPRDARCLNLPNRLGLYQHTHLALTPEGLPLGVVGCSWFDRSPESLGKAEQRQRQRLPIEEKESFRWLTGYRLACDLAERCPETRIVSVADSEADIYDVFLEADQQSAGADFVIRAKEDRRTTEPDPETGPAVYHKVRRQVADSDVRLSKTVSLPRTPKRKAREAELEIRAMTVQVRAPASRPDLDSVTLNVVLIREVNGPEDGTDVCWLLITSLPIRSVQDVELVANCYVARWGIEVYFRIYKSGCSVERIQLEKLDRLKNCLAFYTIIAWRVMYVTYLNRECPSLSCDVVFAESEWKSVWSVTKKTSPPKKAPMLSEFMALLAELGGYNNRPSEPPPGPQTVWVGIRRMTDFAIAWLAFGPDQQTCV